MFEPINTTSNFIFLGCISGTIFQIWLHSTRTFININNLIEYINQQQFPTNHPIVPQIQQNLTNIQQLLTNSLSLSAISLITLIDLIAISTFTYLNSPISTYHIFLISSPCASIITKAIVTGKQIGRASCRERVLRLV